MKKLKLLGTLVLVGMLSMALIPKSTSATVPGVNDRVSVDSSGTQGNGQSYYHSISGDGRYVAFESSATNLVSGDTNGSRDIFLRDRTSSATTRISVDSSGTQSNSDSTFPKISYDGKFVVFQSSASNLVSGDTNGFQDVFIRDVGSGTTTRVSITSGGTQGTGPSTHPDLTSDGRFVVFVSDASNLVTGPTGTFYSAIYLKDLSTGAIRMLNVTSANVRGNNVAAGPKISCDAGVVTFSSTATNLVASDTNGAEDVFIDVIGNGANSLTNITLSGNGSSYYSSVSCNGNQVSYTSGANNLVSGDTNSYTDVFRYNRLSQAHVRESVSTAGTQGNFSSGQSDISDDGRFVTFMSEANTLVSGDSGSSQDVFIRDTKNQTTEAISVDSGGTLQRGSAPQISADGTRISFIAGTANLVPGDTNLVPDIIVSQTGF